MPCLIIDIKQRFGIACEPCVATVDGLAVGVVAVHRQLVVSAHKNRLHGAIGGTCVSECANAGGFQANCSVSASETEDTLRASQPLHDAIAEELLDQVRAGRAYLAGLLQAPLSVVREELARIRW